MEPMKRFLGDRDGLRVFGQPALAKVTLLPPPSTKPTKSTSVNTNHVVSSPVSDQESITSSTPSSPSVFSASLSRSSTWSTASSIPAADQRPTLDQQLATMPIRGRDRVLPCILLDVTGCTIRFPASEFEHWYSHSVSHYGAAGPPDHAMCIFCNTVFDSSDQYRCWRSRMEHIALHMIENNWTLEKSRPDFGVIRDMWEKKCISEEDYNHAMSYSERPPLDGLKPHDWLPDEIKAKQQATERKQNRVVVVEPRQEARAREKRPAKKPGTKPKTSRSDIVVTGPTKSRTQQ